MPVHTLQCGHSFCSICLQRLNENPDSSEPHLIHLGSCPLHDDRSCQNVVLRLKPANAGARTLALDGGGVRGILELVVLDALVKAVGYHIPIQEMFDLVIGTSTGGIIALGLFKEGWSTRKAIPMFETLSRDAFNRRFWMGIPIFKHAAQYMYSYRYDSQAIENALRLAFPRSNDHRLFGQRPKHELDSRKVGVIAMSGENNDRPCLLANYSRDWEHNLVNAWEAVHEFGNEDYLRREDDPDLELKTWEAARCTSAAPTFFQEYRHNPTSRTYTDGGLRFNNPVAISAWERQLVWPEDRGQKPDLMLSVGAGVSSKALRDGHPLSPTGIGRVAHGVLPSGLKDRVVALHQMYRATLDCERQYQEFSRFLGGDAELKARCHRLNVVLPDRPCRLDDVHKLQELEVAARDFLKHDCKLPYDPRFKNADEHIQFLARKIRATLFYFDVVAIQPVTSDGSRQWSVDGRLCCRLSRELRRQFTRLLNGGRRGGCRFRVRSTANSIAVWNPGPETWDMEKFAVRRFLTLPDRDVCVSIEMGFANEDHWTVISGFPRILEAPCNVQPIIGPSTRDGAEGSMSRHSD